MDKKIALYAGSFDPPTKGHEWVIAKSAELFDELFIVVGVNPEKKTYFPLQKRLEWLSVITRHIPNVRIMSSKGRYTAEFARSVGAHILVRGIRNANDFEYEKIIRNVNEEAFPDIESVFLIPPRDIADVSSSLVRQLFGFEDWERVIKKYIPEAIVQEIIREVINAHVAA